MTGTRLMRGLGGATLLCFLWSGAASAGKPARDNFYSVDPAVMRDASGDVQQSDGLGPYAAAEVGTSLLRDFATSVPDRDGNSRTQDYFYFGSGEGGARTTFLSSDLASAAEFGPGSTQPVRCAHYGYFFFESAVTPDWYQELGETGSSVKGWGTTGCYTASDRGYHFVYPGHTSGSTVGECLTMTQTGPDTLTLTAPGSVNDPFSPAPSCSAEVARFVINDGKKTFTPLGLESAPFELTLTLPPVKGNSGKR